MMWKTIAGLAALIAIGTAFFAQRFETRSGPAGSLYVVNRWTGDVKACSPTDCWSVDGAKPLAVSFDDLLPKKK